MCLPWFTQGLTQILQDRVEADRDNFASALLAAQEGYATAIGYVLGNNEGETHSFIIEENGTTRPLGVVGVLSDRTIITAVIGNYSYENRLSLFLSNHRMAMIVYAYEPGEDLAPAAVTELPADVLSMPPQAIDPVNADPNQIPYEQSRLRRSEGRGPDQSRTILVCSLARSSLRQLGRNMRLLQQPIRYRFVIGTRSLSGGVVEIARSELLDFSSADPPLGMFGGTYVPSTTGDTGFDVRHIQGPSSDTGALESVVWSICEEDFVDFAMLCIARTQQSQGMQIVPGMLTQADLEVD